MGRLGGQGHAVGVGFPAKIGSLEQLDDSTRQPLFVAGAQASPVGEGQNLPAIRRGMRQAIKGDAEAERSADSERCLRRATSTRMPTAIRRFELAGTRVVEVGEGFPR
jgi:hypothetical protein